ncbi:MAG TPA: ABC transporter permease [Vicinamibacterales bacterium]|nr:ABC transporter permease [Vicinamibacterales bacterium]
MKRLRRLFRFSSRSPIDIHRDVEAEFAFHLDARTETLQREGLTAGAARDQARREFGAAARGARICEAYDQRAERQRFIRSAIDDFIRDVQYGWRAMRRARAMSLVIVLTLAVAMAGNTAVFALVNALLLKPPLMQEAERVVRLQLGESRMSWPNFEDVRSERSAFLNVVAQKSVVSAVMLGSTSVRVTGANVSPAYFTMLGTPAALGRTLLPTDTRTDLVVISDRFWKTRLAADPAVIGRTLKMPADTVEVVGVMPPGFIGLAPPGLGRDFWIGLDPRPTPQENDRTRPHVEVFARLAPGVSRDDAQAALRVIAERLRVQHPDLDERILSARATGVTGFDAFQGIGRAALPLLAFVALLSVVAGLVLLVACANIAGLLVGRAAARRREIAVRLALGAGRGRLIRQLLVESLMLASAGAALGIVLSIWLTQGAHHAVSSLPFPVEFNLSVDWRVLTYASLLACAAAVIFGLSPARRAARLDLVPALRDEGGAAHQRFRHVLVTGQVFACTVLLLWAALFARSLQNVTAVDPGFTTENVFVVDVDPQDARERTPDASHQRFRLIQERVLELPRVESAGLAWSVPLAFMSQEEHGVLLLGTAATDQRRVMANTVSPGYFATVGIPLRQGRDIAWTDGRTAAPVALVNETAARAFWEGNALGRRLRLADRDGEIDVEVVGVVADSKYWTLGETIAPTLYRPVQQRTFSGMNLFVRTANPAVTIPALRAELERLSPGLPVAVQRLDEATAASMMPARVAAIATAGFGGAAMLLAVLGIYGLVAFSVTQRTRELGVRRAIGASTGNVVRLILGGSLAQVSLGVVPGLVIGSLGALALSSFLVAISPFDLPILAAIALAMLGAGAAASLGPAIRAARIDPLKALRQG